ncbi:MAG: hypothetical protein LBS56_00135 [Propionibacteriaceae bacterium]|jgi:putative ABC transport system permease protein|nr:hypothetical protein [Propionibacteriaceae bacterium]
MTGFAARSMTGFGGLVGAALGVVTVVAIAVVRDWTPILDLKLLLPAPLGGTVIGLLAGLQPAARAARIPPAEAFRR